MKNISTSDGLETDVGNLTGPGRRLRLIREERGIKIQEIAEKLNLRLRVIEAIERDDYEGRSDFVFIRGYLRNYAKLLNIAADEIVAAFNQLGLAEEPILELPPVRTYYRSSYSLKSRSFRWLSYFMVLCLIVLIAFAWSSYKTYSGERKQLLTINPVFDPYTEIIAGTEVATEGMGTLVETLSTN
ncbi:MAG: helix-turn-helix domain-containing protein [Gammaproteobacteria bacterium]